MNWHQKTRKLTLNSSKCLQNGGIQTPVTLKSAMLTPFFVHKKFSQMRVNMLYAQTMTICISSHVPPGVTYEASTREGGQKIKLTGARHFLTIVHSLSLR